MRTAPLLTAGLLLTATLTACSGDAEPQASRSIPRPSPTVTATGTATGSGSASSSPSPSASAAAPGAGLASPTATRTTAPAPAPAAAPPTAAAASPAAARARLTGDGVALPGRVLPFGTTFEQAQPALESALGPPSTDTGVVESFGLYGTCPGTQLRALEYGGGALQLLFGDVDGGTLTLYQWALTGEGASSRVPRASALIGNAATFEFGVGTTVAALQEGAAPASLEVSPGDEVFPASFRLQDQSSGFFGYLTGPGPSDTATFVQGGQGCGE